MLFGMDEAIRLHGIAQTAAIQTGAKGHELDQVIALIFDVLVAQANRDENRPSLKLIEGTN
ncbi:hypothetical protein ASD76_09355 [Altererythrobacter sp. Root672]|nr:hypothetical protein ASD76_09355 [Altererythrobacter sp. Root672]